MIFRDKSTRFGMLFDGDDTPLITALATPYKHGKIHYDSLVKLVTLQNKYADAVVVLGTTGEPLLLSQEERDNIVVTVKLHSDLPSVVGLSGVSTEQAVLQARRAETLGADALLVPPPSFCKCTRNGYIKHILRIADNCTVPLILYNVPSRAAYDITPTIVRVLAEKGVNFVKDASVTGNLVGINKVITLSGSDENLANHLHKGAKGVISVCANAFPLLTKSYMIRHKHEYRLNDGNSTTPQNNHEIDIKKQDIAFETLARLCMREVSPIAVKYLLYKLGIFSTCEMRLPLTAASKQTRNLTDKFLDEFADTIQSTKINGE